MRCYFFQLVHGSSLVGLESMRGNTHFFVSFVGVSFVIELKADQTGTEFDSFNSSFCISYSSFTRIKFVSWQSFTIETEANSDEHCANNQMRFSFLYQHTLYTLRSADSTSWSKTGVLAYIL